MKKRIKTITLAAAVATSFCLAENKFVDAHAKSIRGGSPALLERSHDNQARPSPPLMPLALISREAHPSVHAFVA